MSQGGRIMRPEEIEEKSMEIIMEELSRRGGSWQEEEWPVVKRCIHASADFDYAKQLFFSKGAVKAGIRAIQKGAAIVTDTNMAAVGIDKKKLSRFGGRVCCFMADEEVAAEASARGVTRAAVCMERGSRLPGSVIFAIGNAPTALIRLYELITRDGLRPELVIGVPVGFVNVVEAKELIMKTDVPHIVARGRKGGSSIAAAICNALLGQLPDRGDK